MDKLRSYIKPIKTIVPDADHCAHKGLNNAIEVSHRPARKREKIFGRFKSHRQAQRFLSAHDQINLTFRPRCYQLTTTSYHPPAAMRSACGPITRRNGGITLPFLMPHKRPSITWQYPHQSKALFLGRGHASTRSNCIIQTSNLCETALVCGLTGPVR